MNHSFLRRAALTSAALLLAVPATAAVAQNGSTGPDAASLSDLTSGSASGSGENGSAASASGENGSLDPKTFQSASGENGSADPQSVESASGEGGSLDAESLQSGSGENGSLDPASLASGSGEGAGAGSSIPSDSQLGPVPVGSLSTLGPGSVVAIPLGSLGIGGSVAALGSLGSAGGAIFVGQSGSDDLGSVTEQLSSEGGTASLTSASEGGSGGS